MSIYERLEQDHDRQRELARMLADTSGDTDERRRLWEEFVVELRAHANAEEQTFYAALIENPDTQEQARHSISEHKDADDLIDEINDADMATGAWLQLFKTLRHDVEHHVDEEEDEVFPEARTVIDDATAARLADDFEARKRAEIEAVPR